MQSCQGGSKNQADLKTALGLDPGLGFMHMDTPARDSLACDLMETVRPQVDAYVLDWVSREPLRREWFFEKPDGNCRLTAALSVRLAETARIWGRAVAPVAEWTAHTLWATTQPRRCESAPRRGGPRVASARCKAVHPFRPPKPRHVRRAFVAFAEDLSLPGELLRALLYGVAAALIPGIGRRWRLLSGLRRLEAHVVRRHFEKKRVELLNAGVLEQPRPIAILVGYPETR